jgi:hypothetical protein
MIRIIGVDIPRGWVAVDVTTCPGRVASGVALGEFDEGREVDGFVNAVERHRPDQVAIETPLEPYVFGRGSKGNGEGTRLSVIRSLMQCARLAGRIEQQAIVLGLPVIVTDADTVRKALGIRGRTRTEKDQAVKQYVMTHVRGWPARSNADERDAACVAVYGGMTR